MSKQKTKTVAKNVGANCVRPHFEGMTKTQKGITLIALIITIIVMLILVGVSVTVALNGGLFSTAQKATADTEMERDKELALSDGTIEVDGKKYASYEDYLNNNPMIELPEGWTVAETKPDGWSDKVTAITDGTNTIPLPNGFEISSEEGESTVSTGLVLKDGANEFVWVPVTNSASYTEDSFGPLTATNSTTTFVYDSYQEIQYYYGDTLGTMNSEEDFNKVFTYATDKTNVEESIQTYGGFYVGRYETTIDGTTIGVQQGKTVLTTATLLKEGTNTTSNDEYHYRWWGLYKAQKDMYVNNSSVGSLMISSKQWDEIMTFTGYGSATRATSTYTSKPDLSGSAYVTDSTQYDVSKNIYDLAGNVREFTLTDYYTDNRSDYGGDYYYDREAYGGSSNYPTYGVTLYRF